LHRFKEDFAETCGDRFQRITPGGNLRAEAAVGGRVGLPHDLFRAFAYQLDQRARQRCAFVVSHGAGDRRQTARTFAHRGQSIRGHSDGNDHRKSTVFRE